MKIIFLIILSIISPEFSQTLGAQLRRIDHFGEVDRERTKQEGDLVLRDTVMKSLKTSTIEPVGTLSPEKTLKSKVFHPPLKKMIPTSQFGMRIHPISGTRKMHTGIDLKAFYEPVYSIADGVVKHAGWGDKEGYFVIINHGEVKSVYCHLSKISVTKGTVVKAGDVVGVSGNTGSSTGPHLHFGVKWREARIDPEYYLRTIDWFLKQ